MVKKILICDNDILNQKIVSMVFKKVLLPENNNNLDISHLKQFEFDDISDVYSYKSIKISLHFVISALTAIKCYDLSTFHLIITDMNMEGMEGWEFSDYLQKNFKPLKIIMLTSNVEKKNIERAKELGIFYCIKPLTKEIAKHILEKYLA